MSPTDSEPMSGDDLAREIANIATKQVYYSDPYITNDGVLCIENRSKFTHTTSPQIIEPTLKDISNQAEKNQMDDDLARHIANLDLQEVHNTRITFKHHLKIKNDRLGTQFLTQNLFTDS